MKLAQLLVGGKPCLAAEVNGRLMDLSATNDRLPTETRVLCGDASGHGGGARGRAGWPRARDSIPPR